MMREMTVQEFAQEPEHTRTGWINRTHQSPVICLMMLYD